MITAINEKYILLSAGFIKKKRKKGKDRMGEKVLREIEGGS